MVRVLSSAVMEGHVGQPGAVAALFRPGKLQGIGHGLSGEGGAVGEGEAGADDKGPYQLVLAD